MIGLVNGPPFITVNGLRLRSVLAACWVYPAYNASPSKQSHTRSIQEIFWPLFFLEQRAKSNKTSEAGRYRERPSARVPREERQRTQWPSRKGMTNDTPDVETGTGNRRANVVVWSSKQSKEATLRTNLRGQINATHTTPAVSLIS